MSEYEIQPLSDADVLAWAVVLSCRARQKRDGSNILLLPYPPCPTCGEPVYEAEQVTLDRFTVINIRLALLPCGHVHTTSDDYVRRLWPHIHEMVTDALSGYHGHATEARAWTTEEIVHEARTRVAGTAPERDDDPAPILMPAVQFDGATVLPLKGDPGSARQVLAGNESARFTIDGVRYATSAEHPVIVEPFGPGIKGGFVTFTLITSAATVNGKEIGNV